MTWDSSRNWAVRGRLAGHLGRLQQHLDAAGEQVREAVATAVGRTVAEAIGEAVYDALLLTSTHPAMHHVSTVVMPTAPRGPSKIGMIRPGDVMRAPPIGAIPTLTTATTTIPIRNTDLPCAMSRAADVGAGP
jgi:hypothetical protein